MVVDVDALRSVIEGRLGSRVSGMRPLGSGAWSKAYAFVAGGDHLVVRVSPHASHFEKDRFAGRWSCPSVPIPEVLMIEQDDGWWFSISTVADGEPVQALSSEEWERVAPAFVNCLREIGASDLAGTSGWGRWDGTGQAPSPSWREFLLTVGDDPLGSGDMTWRENLDKRGPDAAHVFDHFYRQLQQLDVAAPRGLVHADLLNGNVHIRAESIAGVFDWGQAMFGDPIYEAAMIDFVAPAYPALNLAEAARSVLEAQAPSLDRLLACYLHHGLLLLAVNARQQDWALYDVVRDRLRAIQVGEPSEGR